MSKNKRVEGTKFYVAKTAMIGWLSLFIQIFPIPTRKAHKPFHMKEKK